MDLLFLRHIPLLDVLLWAFYYESKSCQVQVETRIRECSLASSKFISNSLSCSRASNSSDLIGLKWSIGHQGTLETQFNCEMFKWYEWDEPKAPLSGLGQFLILLTSFPPSPSTSLYGLMRKGLQPRMKRKRYLSVMYQHEPEVDMLQSYSQKWTTASLKGDPEEHRRNKTFTRGGQISSYFSLSILLRMRNYQRSESLLLSQ